MTSSDMPSVLGIYRQTKSHKEIQEVLQRSKEGGMSLMWQGHLDHKTIYQISILDLNLENKVIVVTYDNKADLIDPLYPVYVKLHFRDTLFKGKVIKFENNHLTLSIPGEIHMREYRDSVRIRFSTDEESAHLRLLLSGVATSGTPSLKINLFDVSSKGLGLLISKHNIHLFKTGQIIELIGFSRLEIFPPIVGRVVYCLRHSFSGKNLLYRVGIELAAPIPDEKFEELTKSKRSQYQTTAKDILESTEISLGLRAKLQSIEEKTLGRLKKDEKLKSYLELWENVSKNNFYICEHIKMLPYVCGHFLEIMNMAEDHLLEDFFYASYLHDAPLFEQPRLCRIKNLKDFNKLKDQLSEQEIELFLKSPELSSQLILGHFIITNEVAEILLKQKELSSGDGFPGKLTHQEIPQHVAIFILAHDLTEEIILNFDWSIERWLLKVREVYTEGTFKLILDSLADSKLRIKSKVALA